MTLNTAQRSQRDADITDSLNKAGIGRSYHHQTLSALPAGKGVLGYFTDDALVERHAQGKGLTIVGGGTDAYDATILLARALHLKGLAARVLSLAQLAMALSAGTEDADLAVSVKSLFLTGFFETYGDGGCPLTTWQIASIESLLTTRVDNSRPIFLLASEWGGKTWWSGRLVQRVAKSNRLVEIRS